MRRLPKAVRGLALTGARAAWLPLALSEAWAFARRQERRTPLMPLFLDCLMAGAWPREAWLWRELFGERIELGARAVSLLLSALGDPSGRLLLADKAAADRTLRAAGVGVPETLAIIRPGSAERDLRPVRQAGMALVIKPQGGYGSIGLTMAEPLAGDRWRVNGNDVTWEDLSGKLRGANQPLLAQRRLRPAQELDGLLEAERPPVLRMATARRPHAAPFLQGALLSIPVPGNLPGDFYTKDIRAPVDSATGRLHAAILLAKPRERLSTLPWNGAQVEGRVLAGFPAAVQAVLAAASAIPPLPIVGWDVVLTDAGPVILEGNAIGNWVLANFDRLDRPDAPSLVPLLAEWARDAEARRA